MKRQKRTAYQAPAYPNLRAFLARAGRVAAHGLVVSTVVAAGCDLPTVGGDVAVPGETGNPDDTGPIPGDVWETGIHSSITLPETGSRYLTFKSGAWGQIAYHLVVVVRSEAVAQAMEADAEAVLTAVDAALQPHGIHAFEEGQDLSSIEAELVSVVANAAGASSSDVVDLTLHVDEYYDEDDIDGDMGVAR